MKALVLVGKDQPLMFEEVADPATEVGFSIVKIKAAAMNHRDIWIQKGLYAGIKYPCILGSDGAGELPDGSAVIINSGYNWGDNPAAQIKEFKKLFELN